MHEQAAVLLAKIAEWASQGAHNAKCGLLEYYTRTYAYLIETIDEHQTSWWQADIADSGGIEESTASRPPSISASRTQPCSVGFGGRAGNPAGRGRTAPAARPLRPAGRPGPAVPGVEAAPARIGSLGPPMTAGERKPGGGARRVDGAVRGSPRPSTLLIGRAARSSRTPARRRWSSWSGRRCRTLAVGEPCPFGLGEPLDPRVREEGDIVIGDA
jgi:hypothetical protein